MSKMHITKKGKIQLHKQIQLNNIFQIIYQEIQLLSCIQKIKVATKNDWLSMAIHWSRDYEFPRTINV